MRRTRLSLTPLETRQTPTVYTVNNTIDSGTGSLRQAILDANGNPGADSINFDLLVFNAANTITLNGQLSITDAVTITGTNAKMLTVNANQTGRVFFIDAPGNANAVAISGMTITGGSAQYGGGIFNQDEALTLTDCVVTNNTSLPVGNLVGGGGGLWVASNAAVTIDRCTISNNAVSGSNGIGGPGAGLALHGGSLTLTNCTVSGNAATGVAAYCAGLYWHGTAGTIAITNCTFAGNSAPNGAGALDINRPAGALNIFNSTITGNSSGSTFGSPRKAVDDYSYAAGGTTTVRSTIISGNTGGAGDLTCNHAVVLSNSAIGVAPGLLVTDQGGNLPFGASLNLGTLANNGGPTQTVALLSGSPCINAGANPSSLQFDQRGSGFARVVGAAADIGAFEVQASQAPPTVSSVVVNGGGAQRSMVTSLKVTFSEAVTFPNGIAAAFQLNRVGQPSGGPEANAPLGLVNLNESQSAAVVIITFAAGGAVPIEPAGSLIDGTYQLTIVAANVQGAGGAMTANYQTPGLGQSGRIFRLFGDGNGTATVDVFDFGLFMPAFGTNNPTFDFDSGGSVDVLDFGQFRARFGTSVP